MSSSGIIGHWQLRNLRTGRNFGPTGPIYKEDFPLRELPGNSLLLRYLEIWKFEDMLRSSSLYFCRVDKFTDNLEGTLSAFGVYQTSRSDRERPLYSPITEEEYAVKSDYQAGVKACYFVNCWHRNARERVEMWNGYAPGRDSVVVTTSGKGLFRALGGEAGLKERGVCISPVKYVSSNTPRTDFGGISHFYYKDEAFSFENEVRLLRPLRGNEVVYEDEPTDFYRRIKVNLRFLIHRVIVRSDISRDGLERIERLVKKFCPRAQIEVSQVL